MKCVLPSVIRNVFLQTVIGERNTLSEEILNFHNTFRYFMIQIFHVYPTKQKCICSSVFFFYFTELDKIFQLFYLHSSVA